MLPQTVAQQNNFSSTQGSYLLQERRKATMPESCGPQTKQTADGVSVAGCAFARAPPMQFTEANVT